MIVDLFAGPGGWDEGLRLLGVQDVVVGLELDSAACATAEAAGHLRYQDATRCHHCWPQLCSAIFSTSRTGAMSATRCERRP